ELLYRIPPASLSVALHRPRLPGALHLLSLAADRRRACLPHARSGKRHRRDGSREGILPAGQGILLRRRYVYGRSSEGRRDRQGPRETRHHVVLQLAGKRAVRVLEDLQGQWTKAAARRLR